MPARVSSSCWPRSCTLESPSTKDTLENTFAFLHRKAAVHSTNAKMSDPCKFLYTIVSPYAESGGCPQILPEASDFTTVLSPNGLPDRKYANRMMFAPNRVELPNPEVFPRPAQILSTKWRNSGPLAQQRASAAVAYLMEDVNNDFSHVDLCWIGRLVR